MQKALTVPSFAVNRLSGFYLVTTVVSLIVCSMLVCRPAIAQSGQQFVGHVEDSSHASIPGATVTVHN